MIDDLEEKAMENQLEEELNILYNTIRKITKATTTKELFKLMLVANKYLSDICRDKEYIISIEENKNGC